MATVDDVVRTLLQFAKKEGATKASVLAGLHAEYKSVPKKQMAKLIQQAYVQIAKAQPK